jgi:hypothetical protein
MLMEFETTWNGHTAPAFLAYEALRSEERASQHALVPMLNWPANLFEETADDIDAD